MTDKEKQTERHVIGSGHREGESNLPELPVGRNKNAPTNVRRKYRRVLAAQQKRIVQRDGL